MVIQQYIINNKNLNDEVKAKIEEENGEALANITDQLQEISTDTQDKLKENAKLTKDDTIDIYSHLPTDKELADHLNNNINETVARLKKVMNYGMYLIKIR